jgi:hypothetical protein
VRQVRDLSRREKGESMFAELYSYASTGNVLAGAFAR